ncbi:MAG: SurA N-terminal domain-containing protein [Humidesulfovibrio sp.]|uniref:SurA N-terminal domain-containing protein n=1 Tax=Humidesulfovibrio sp. TaxID=2910988 RepID=UPI002736ECD8|nr:SurA N-terminal domain-containing protein [Humidesulfovibrio sp.]MDP2846707.1 SurA N-terminal domain-containing protein [Humidesulfovibrio sp.]
MLERLRQNAGSLGIKIAFGIIILVFIFSFGTGSFTDRKEPVVAYVGDEAISAREFQKAYEDAVTGMRRQNPSASAEDLNTPQFKQAVLSQLVNTKLLLGAARKMGVTVSPAELRAVISSIPAFQGATGAFDPAIYKNALAQTHSTPKRFEEDLKSSQLIQKLQGFSAVASMVTEPEAKGLFQWARETVRIDTMTFPVKTFADQVKPTEAQLQAYYDAAKDRFKEPARIRLEYLPITVADLAAAQKISDEDVKKQYEAGAEAFKHPAQMRARHILILVPANAPQEAAEKSLAQIKAIQTQLKKGASFEALAKNNSQDPGSAAKGGELPWFSEGAMDKPFEDAAKALKPGQISDPVRTQFGWHLIKLEATRPAGKVPFEEAAGEIKKRMAEERASEKINEILDQSMDQIAAGVKLAKIAQGLGLSTQKSEMLDMQALQSIFGLKKEAAETLFALANGAGAKTPLSMDPARGYLLAEKIEGAPEALLPLDKVKDKVVAEVKREEGRKQALEKAKEVLAQLGNAETQAKALAQYKAEFKTSAPLDRQTAISQVGGNPQMLQDIFSAPDKAWLKQPYELPEAVVLARINERIAAPEADWDKEKRLWIGQGAAAFRQEVFEALLKNLRATTKVEIVRQDLLN